jgi:hypothetical protein
MSMPTLPDLRRRLHDRERESSRLEDRLRAYDRTYDRTAPLAPLPAEFEDALDRAEDALLEAVLELAVATGGREPSAAHWVWHYLQVAPTAAAGELLIRGYSQERLAALRTASSVA